MRILHLSDLHVVASNTLTLVDNFNKKLIDLPFKLQVHPATETGRDLLLQHIKHRHAEQFDAIVVTGDLTGLGDDASMVLAGEYLQKLSVVALKKNTPLKNVIIIPGNHDVLELTLTAFIDAVEKKVGNGVSFLFRLLGGDVSKIVSHLKGLLAELRPAGAFALGSDEVDSFRDYIRASFNMKLSTFTTPELLGPTSLKISGRAFDRQPVQVRFSLINTLTFLPFLFSAGTISELDAANLVHDLDRTEDSVAIALTHQGLLALPKLFHSGGSSSHDIALIFEHSLASLVNGYNLARVLQTNRVEVHLHGHEHHHTASSFDFELSKPGALFSFGAPTAGQIEGAEFGFNMLQFEAADVVKVQSHLYNNMKAAFEPATPQFVKLRDHAPERLTRIARGELYRIFYSSTEHLMASKMSQEAYTSACDDLFDNSSNSLLYFGVRLKSVRRAIIKCLYDGDKDRQNRFKKRLKLGVNFLVTASTSLYDAKGAGEEEMKEEWRDFFKEVGENLSMNAEELSRRIQVRTTVAPLSHAGIVEYSKRGATGARFHRALVQTVMFQRMLDSELYFEVRENVTNGFLSYYAGTVFNLWNRKSEKLDLTKLD
ncbi:metallophosphoesterase [Bradyrhizobium sp. CCGB20]|uniref:metallophosphoesterase family protein n=1 Tax=Bradyrhizobium sp. CCGB20 TaxID=2949633 RepID=UPI0020B3239C|nr:metallophosphoesterase [Bradyrhizobium sp. CCGB20]MCP3395678.1 metallophosphoesterase [Bradyrhizobium sp. CCGB20]